MDQLQSLAPLGGFLIALMLLFAALSVFLLCLWGLVPFAVFTLRREAIQQRELLTRIERLLAQQTAPPAQVAAPPEVPQTAKV